MAEMNAVPDHVPAETKLSVLIAAYNAEKYIKRAVSSVLQETVIPLEVIVVDDASTDSTVSCVHKISAQDNRVKLLSNEANAGPSYTRNRAIAAAKGKWLAVLDADDEFQPGRMPALIRLGEETQSDIVCDYLRPVTEDDAPISGFVMYPIVDGEKTYQFISPEDFLKADMPGEGGIKAGYLKPVIKKSFLDENGLRYAEDIRVGEDALMLFECLVNGARLVVTQQAMYDYRMSPGSLTRQVSRNNYRMLRSVNDRMKQLAMTGRYTEAVALLDVRGKAYECLERYQRITAEVRQGKSLQAVRHAIEGLGCAGDFIRTFMRRRSARKKMQAGE